jgi:hypothetical protein
VDDIQADGVGDLLLREWEGKSITVYETAPREACVQVENKIRNTFFCAAASDHGQPSLDIPLLGQSEPGKASIERRLSHRHFSQKTLIEDAISDVARRLDGVLRLLDKYGIEADKIAGKQYLCDLASVDREPPVLQRPTAKESAEQAVTPAVAD